ncbi:LacI family DNA-binding transcriptional regulator [Flindersiella endophytica]
MADRAKLTAEGGATLRDVAERAGVSISTVSRVLGGSYPAAAATRARVMQAVEELDYVANAQARALAGGGTKLIAVLVPLVGGNDFGSYVAQGIDEQCVDEGRICLLSNTSYDPDRELAVIRLMREQRADAVILVGGVPLDPEYDTRMRQHAHALAAAGSRLVLVGRPPLGPDVPAITVEYDNAGGAQAATNYLLSHGHRRILYLGARPGHTAASARLEGYRRGLADHGVAYDESLVVEGEFSRPSGYRMMRERLAREEPPDFTAILAGDDPVAVGARHALREVGLRIPDDLSMVGYDDLAVAGDLGLTSVHIPYEELGRTAVRLALHQRDTRDHDQTSIHRVLGTHLVIRDSVRPRAIG